MHLQKYSYCRCFSRFLSVIRAQAVRTVQRIPTFNLDPVAGGQANEQDQENAQVLRELFQSRRRIRWQVKHGVSVGSQSG